MKGLSVSHQQVIRDLRDLQSGLRTQTAKQEEIEAQLSTWVRDKVRLELREQLAEMDAKKVDVDRFERVTERKLEKTAIKEVKKDLNQMRSEFEVRLTEVGTKVDLIRRD